jgi:WD40 repeat protein
MVNIWDLESGQQVHSLKGHTRCINIIAVTPDGRQVVSGSSNKIVKVWDLESGRLIHSLKGHMWSVKAVAMTPDGRQVVCGSNDNIVKVWNLLAETDSSDSPLALLQTLFAPDAIITSLALSTDGYWLVCGDSVGRAWIFEWIH